METSGGFKAAGETILSCEIGVGAVGVDTEVCKGNFGDMGEGEKGL
jgi:hypothetical protein